MAASDSSNVEELRLSWLTPFEAIRILIDAGLRDEEHAVGWLVARLKSGELRAAGIIADISDEFAIVGMHSSLLKSRAWDKAHLIHWKNDFWVSGDYADTGDDDGVLSEFDIAFGILLTGVRFKPDLILQFRERAAALKLSSGNSSSTALTSRSAEKPARRGAKRKDWWDHLWIEMIRRIRAGTLKPAKVGDLQEILEEYVREELGYDAGDSTLKPMASNLFKYLEEISGEIGENPRR